MTCKGIFTWGREERASGRHGAFVLGHSTKVDLNYDMPRLNLLEGLCVSVQVTTADNVVDLGKGTLRLERPKWTNSPAIALVPDDGREENWFDPTLLRRLRNQPVRVDIVEVLQ